MESSLKIFNEEGLYESKVRTYIMERLKEIDSELTSYDVMLVLRLELEYLKENEFIEN